MIELAIEMEFSSLSAALFVKMLITFTLFSEQAGKVRQLWHNLFFHNMILNFLWTFNFSYCLSINLNFIQVKFYVIYEHSLWSSNIGF